MLTQTLWPAIEHAHQVEGWIHILVVAGQVCYVAAPLCTAVLQPHVQLDAILYGPSCRCRFSNLEFGAWGSGLEQIQHLRL